MAYDANGNLSYDLQGNRYTYDSENRLIGAAAATGQYSYGYDVLGRRRSKTAGAGVPTYYVYDGPQVIAEYSGSTLAKKFIYGPGIDQPIAMIRVDGYNETWYYYLQDGLGNVIALIDGSGSIVEKYEYEPFGKPRFRDAGGNEIAGSAVDNPYLFTGRRWDGETETYYYRFRNYAPDLGRFMQNDPLGYIDSMNSYAYCVNNPTNYIDPMGLWSLWRWIYTGDGNASDDVYGAATDAAGEYLYQDSPVRGGYVGVGGQVGKIGGSVQAGWSIDNGFSIGCSVGLSGQFGKSKIGAGGNYDYSPYSGNHDGSSGIIGEYEGGHCAFDPSSGGIGLGVNAGPFFGGITIDPSKFFGNNCEDSGNKNNNNLNEVINGSLDSSSGSPTGMVYRPIIGLPGRAEIIPSKKIIYKR